ncbi:MAG: ribonuclease HII [Sphaerochaetaceae bacterium]
MALICGIDEAGRGPLAGPVCAGAVVLPKDFPFEILKDSKKLSPKRRLEAEKIIKEGALCWSVAWANHKEIDKFNILGATFLAMQRAFKRIDMAVDLVVVDGNQTPQLGVACYSIVKGDASVFEIMAASILAKTARDRFMIKMDALYPRYGYAQHKGYPTLTHRQACRQWGASPIQRLTFNY